MIRSTFDPQKFIDREREKKLFEELLQLRDEARILAIRDVGGMGKTHLLLQLQYRCRTANQSRIPVSLVTLDEFLSPLALVQQIERDLSSFSLDFPTFSRYEAARRGHDFTTIRGAVDLREADMQHAQVQAAGVINNIEHLTGPVSFAGAPQSLTPEQQAMAQTYCLQAFLVDLHQCCRQQLVVIMLDAYEKCGPNLRRWLLQNFLELYCFNLEHRPARLVVVIAGRQIPDFEFYWPLRDCETIAKSVRALSQWTAAHVEECLRVHNFGYNERQFELFCAMIEQGLPPSQVVDAMNSIFMRA